MAVKTKRTVKQPKKYTKQDLSIYINLLTDFGFKRVFGIKEVMLNFLNTVLNIEGGITDLTYGNVEILGLTKNDRKAIFDLICITGNGERIIVEIQNIEQEHYRDRMLVYASQLIQEQNVKGKVNNKYWNFKLDPIYSINIMNFLLGKKKRPNKYLTQWQLKELDTNEVLYDKLTFVCIELPLFSKKLRGVKTALEQWIFLIKSLHELKNIPKKYKTEIFQKIFEMAKIAKMSKEDVKKYIKSLNDMSLVEYEINRRDIAIEKRDIAIAAIRAERDIAWNTIVGLQSNNAALQSNNAALQNQIEEYKRRYGQLNGKMI
ncbi:MAG: Rpn family recombination-promoting nuclease/putative transposase [Marinilabiliaceae bacterium]|nr:Rpn family recombination-promoting nuclease/putative transposase [Marinilabiliaceae bacterium]